MTTTTSPNRRARIITIVLLVFGVLLTLWFGTRSLRSFRHVRERGFRPPPMATADVTTLRGWMTLPYVAVAYGVPEEYLFHELKIPPESNREASLVELNRRYRTGEEGQVLRELQEAILQFRRRHEQRPPREPPPDAAPGGRDGP